MPQTGNLKTDSLTGTPPTTSAAPSIAYWDCETDGLLKEATKLHCIAASLKGKLLSGASQPGYMPIETILRELEEVDIRVAHNGNDFDERVVRKVYPWWKPKGRELDTLLISRLLYPSIIKNGPNNHKLPKALRGRHSLEAWGMRLGVHKDTKFNGGDWQHWTPEMQTYMNADVPPLERLFKWLMAQKPSMQAVELEHKFATIIRRQEAWGFTFDAEKAAILANELQERERILENELKDFYGEWWQPSPVKTVGTTREVKMTDYPDITKRRFSATTGKEIKPYVGPPKCSYEEGAKYTPIQRVEFSPASRTQVILVLKRDHGWEPKTFTEKGTPKVDDEVLRALPWPEAQKLADYFFVEKLLGYVSSGKKAWMKTMAQEGSEFRQHGRINTIGAGSFRCAHSDPNVGQVPTRHVIYGHRARELFRSRRGFRLVGYDGSAMQLRLLAHYLAPYDGGAFLKVFESGESPHAYTRDQVGTDIMGEGDPGKAKGKTTNYALVFGGGDFRLGQIVQPNTAESHQRKTGKIVRERLNERFQLDALINSLKEKVEERHYLVGLDGRKCPVTQGRLGLAFLLQMGEAVVMRQAKVLLDERLKAAGLRCGVDEAGNVKPLHLVDYEFCADVHDESQADVREGRPLELYKKFASECVRDAGILLKVRCPLASDVKDGETWADTH